MANTGTWPRGENEFLRGQYDKAQDQNQGGSGN